MSTVTCNRALLFAAIALLVMGGCGESAGENARDAFIAEVAAGRSSRYLEMHDEIARCMEDRGFEYTIPDDLTASTDVGLIDPGYTLRTLDRRTSLGIAISEGLVREYVATDPRIREATANAFEAAEGQNGGVDDEPDHTAELEIDVEVSAEEFARNGALYGDPEQEGCREIGEAAVNGIATIETAWSTFAEEFYDEYEEIRADSKFQTLEVEYQSCIVATSGGPDSLLGVFEFANVTVGEILSGMVADGQLEGDEDIDAAVTKLREKDQELFDNFERCASPLQEAAIKVIDSHFDS